MTSLQETSRVGCIKRLKCNLCVRNLECLVHIYEGAERAETWMAAGPWDNMLVILDPFVALRLRTAPSKPTVALRKIGPSRTAWASVVALNVARHFDLLKPAGAIRTTASTSVAEAGRRRRRRVICAGRRRRQLRRRVIAAHRGLRRCRPWSTACRLVRRGQRGELRLELAAAVERRLRVRRLRPARRRGRRRGRGPLRGRVHPERWRILCGGLVQERSTARDQGRAIRAPEAAEQLRRARERVGHRGWRARAHRRILGHGAGTGQVRRTLLTHGTQNVAP